VLIVCIHCQREQEHPDPEVLNEIRSIRRLIHEQGENSMASFDDLAASVLTLTNTVSRVAADLEALKNSGGLTAEQQAILDKAVADLNGDEATLEAVDPAPAEETPAE